jgi:hypothetical protein
LLPELLHLVAVPAPTQLKHQLLVAKLKLLHLLHKKALLLHLQKMLLLPTAKSTRLLMPLLHLLPMAKSTQLPMPLLHLLSIQLKKPLTTRNYLLSSVINTLKRL